MNKVSQVVKKGHQCSSLILRCFKCRKPLLLSKAFVVYARPLLKYCSPAWAPVYIPPSKQPIIANGGLNVQHHGDLPNSHLPTTGA